VVERSLSGVEGLVETTGQNAYNHWSQPVPGRLVPNAASPETLVRAFRMKGYLIFWKVRKFAFRVGNNEKH